MKGEPQNAALPAAADTDVLALPAVVARATPAATAATLTGTLGLAAACWAIAVWQMHGMDMGTATQLGSFGAFIAVWVAMMAAMMLPGAAPAVLRRARARGVRAVPLFAGAYLAVWALAGVAVYAAYRPHGTLAAGAVVIAAAVYEVTPLKRHFRRRCRDSVRSGFRFGLCCAGSSLGLMADAGGAGCHEHHLDGGDRHPRPRAKAAAPQSRRRCAARAGHHRAWYLDHPRGLVGAWAHATDDVRSSRLGPGHAVCDNKKDKKREDNQ